MCHVCFQKVEIKTTHFLAHPSPKLRRRKNGARKRRKQPLKNQLKKVRKKIREKAAINPGKRPKR